MIAAGLRQHVKAAQGLEGAQGTAPEVLEPVAGLPLRPQAGRLGGLRGGGSPGAAAAAAADRARLGGRRHAGSHPAQPHRCPR